MRKIALLALAASMAAAPLSTAEAWDHGYRRGVNPGAAAAAGIMGLAAGAIIGGAIANQQAQAAPPPPATVDPQLAAYCARKYRSFDAATGTYLSRRGEWIACTY